MIVDRLDGCRDVTNNQKHEKPNEEQDLTAVESHEFDDNSDGFPVTG